jgi:hypothetical protein
LEHNGDSTAAGRALSKLGYGKPSGKHADQTGVTATIPRGCEGQRTPRADADVLEMFEAAPVWTQPDGKTEKASHGDDKPQILLTTDEARVARESIDALAELGWKPGHDPADRVYQRQGRLVQVIRSPAIKICGVSLPDGSLRIRPLPRSIVRERIGTAAMLAVETRDGLTVKRPPDWLVNAVSDRGQYPDRVRNLTGIVRCPTLRPDGSVFQEPGHDPATGLLYVPDGEFPQIEDHPTREAARQAADDLLDVVSDFPFVGPAHSSVWLATAETMVGRSAVPGCVPILAFDANTRGAGKSLLVDAASMIAYGNRLARKTWTDDDNEVRKTITAVAIEGVSAVLWDNATGVFGSPSLDAAVTGSTWTDRILGTNTTTGDLPLTTIWLATGNNMTIGADTARRVLYSRIESPDENPEERTGFTHPELLPWVQDNRNRLATAAVTLLRAYVAAGRPSQNLTPWGSFEAWSNLIRSAIVWVGLTDPCGTRAIVRAADRSAELLRMFLDGVQEADVDGIGITSGDIHRLLSHPLSEDKPDPCPTLRAAVGEACEKCSARSIGYALRQYVGRVCGGRRLVNRLNRRLKVKVWAVDTLFKVNTQILAGDAGDAGNCGDLPNPKREKSWSYNSHSAPLDTS